MIEDRQLLALNRRGLFPGPDEGIEAFLKRVSLLEEFSEDPQLFFEKRKQALPLKAVARIDARVSRNDLDWVLAKLSKSFDLLPAWLVSFYSNEDLPFWQAAACWVIEVEGVELSFVQLKEGLKGGSYLKLYKRDEILVHEAIHAARMAFDEPKFEEVLAYLASSSSFRRTLGPLFSSSKNVLLVFCPLILGGLLLPVFPTTALLSYLGGTLWLILQLFSLLRRHSLVKRASNRLLKLIHDPKKVRGLLLRLTDHEMVYFAKSGSEEVKRYIQKAKGETLRWRVLYLAYISDNY